MGDIVGSAYEEKNLLHYLSGSEVVILGVAQPTYQPYSYSRSNIRVSIGGNRRRDIDAMQYS